MACDERDGKPNDFDMQLPPAASVVFIGYAFVLIRFDNHVGRPCRRVMRLSVRVGLTRGPYGDSHHTAHS